MGPATLTGVPGLLLPMPPPGWRGEFIIPPAAGDDIGREVAGEPGPPGMGLAPGGTDLGPL